MAVLTIAYTMAQYPAKAMKAYEKAHAWRELFTLANEQKLDAEAIAAMVERVTGDLNNSITMPELTSRSPIQSWQEFGGCAGLHGLRKRCGQRGPSSIQGTGVCRSTSSRISFALVLMDSR